MSDCTGCRVLMAILRHLVEWIELVPSTDTEEESETELDKEKKNTEEKLPNGQNETH